MAEEQKSSILPDLLQTGLPGLIAAGSANPSAAFSIAQAVINPFVETRSELKQSKLDDLRMRGLETGFESAEFELGERKKAVQRSDVDRGRKMARDTAQNTYFNQTSAAMQKLGIVPDDSFWDSLMKRPGAYQALGMHEGIQLYLGSLSDSRLEPALDQLLGEHNIKKITGIDELIKAVDSQFPGSPRNEQIYSMARDLPEDEQATAVFFMDMDQGNVVPVNVDTGQRLMAEGYGLFAKEAKLEWKRQENMRTIKGETINFGTDLMAERGMDISTAQNVSESIIAGFKPWEQNKFAFWNGAKNFEKKTDPVAVDSFLNQLSQSATSQGLSFELGGSLATTMVQDGVDENDNPIMKYMTQDFIDSKLSGNSIFKALNSRANAFTEGQKARAKPAKPEAEQFRMVGGSLHGKKSGKPWEVAIKGPEKVEKAEVKDLTSDQILPYMEEATRKYYNATGEKGEFDWQGKFSYASAAVPLKEHSQKFSILSCHPCQASSILILFLASLSSQLQSRRKSCHPL